MTTFFDGEIISKRYPFLTRKWDADEEVDRKHWVIIYKFELIGNIIIEAKVRLKFFHFYLKKYEATG